MHVHFVIYMININAMVPLTMQCILKVVLGGSPRCPDNQVWNFDWNNYTLLLRPLMAAKNHLHPISLTVSNFTPKIIRDNPLGPPEIGLF